MPRYLRFSRCRAHQIGRTAWSCWCAGCWLRWCAWWDNHRPSDDVELLLLNIVVLPLRGSCILRCISVHQCMPEWTSNCVVKIDKHSRNRGRETHGGLQDMLEFLCALFFLGVLRCCEMLASSSKVHMSFCFFLMSPVVAEV